MLSERVVEMAETEREKEVQVEKVVDVWSYNHAKLPCWWWLAAITLGPILLVVRLLVIAVLVINRFQISLTTMKKTVFQFSALSW